MISKKALFSTFVFLSISIVILFLISIPNRETGMDESLFAEQVFMFGKDGVWLKTYLFNGMGLDFETRQYHYHKFFILLGVLFVQIFGYSIYTFKAIPLLFLIGFTFLAKAYLKKFGKETTTNLNIIWLIWMVILLFQHEVFMFSFYYRPEIILMTIGFSSFYFLEKWVSSQDLKYLIFSAIFAGLSAFTHLNGLIFIFAGFILLLNKKKYKEILYFMPISGLTAAFYLFDIWHPADFLAFLDQFRNDYVLEKEDFSIFTPFIKIFREHKRFFHDYEEAFYSSLLILCLIFNFKYLKENHSNLLVYYLALVIGLAGLSHGTTSKYALLHLPFASFIIAVSLYRILALEKWQQVVLIIAFWGAIFSHLYNDLGHTFNKRDITAINEHISSYLPKEEQRVLADDIFVFNQIKNHHINGLHGFMWYYKFKVRKEPTPEDFFNFAEKHNNQYIVLYPESFNDELMGMMQKKDIVENKNYFGYGLLEKNEEFVILKKL
ncbi:ArnT family glycosyltransferase [Flexithrix dorotheae]|uniref:ArnT family glycosyltransferase n=1 Tax=Flexithrix dorotheae TaxID=70993 RepID=UPI00036B1AD2|nr:hypothetical protein [Flexithrix dorotheae]